MNESLGKQRHVLVKNFDIYLAFDYACGDIGMGIFTRKYEIALKDHKLFI